MRHFGSLKKLRSASAEEIAQVPGFGRRSAEGVVAALAADRARPSQPAVNTATGEILDDDAASTEESREER
jgi:excinuclease ABC subunit C